MNEIREKYLPVGTVVLLKNGKKRIMVTGFCVTPEGKNDAFDYCGCLYPEGFLSSNQNCLFNHNQIEKVFHMGLVDEEEIKFKEQLRSLIDMADQFSKFKNNDSDETETVSSESSEISSNTNEETESLDKLDNMVELPIETNNVEEVNVTEESTNNDLNNTSQEFNLASEFNITNEQSEVINSNNVDNSELNNNNEIETLDDFMN